MSKQKQHLKQVSESDIDQWFEALRNEPTPLSQDPGMETRFWKRFSFELGGEEQRRQVASLSPKYSGWEIFRKMSAVFALTAGFYGFLWVQTHEIFSSSPSRQVAKAPPSPSIPPSKKMGPHALTKRTAPTQRTKEEAMYREFGMLREMEMMENLDTIEWLDKKG